MPPPSSAPAKPRSRPVVTPPEPSPDTGRYVRAFRAVLALCFLASLALSYPLWISARDYPLVPLIDGLPQLPPPLDAVLFGAMCAALLAAAALPRPRIALQAVLAIGGTWAVLDLNRWQPYFAYYLVATACLLMAEGGRTNAARHAPRWALAPLQLFTCCMYVYSGLHKLNHHYFTTDFLLTAKPLLGWLHVDAASVPARVVWPLALLSALAELAFGALLLTRRGRRAGVIGLTAMHAFILLMIGPLGASWNRVVWPWNVAAVAALWLLFWPAAPYDELRRFIAALRTRGGVDGKRSIEGVPRALKLTWYAVLIASGVMPALSFFGLGWAPLSFHLYAGKERIALINYEASQAGAMPSAALHASRTPGQVNVAAWSISELNAAPVLEDRVLLRVGRTLARRAPGANVALLIASPPALLTGERTTRYFVFRGPAQEPFDASAEVSVQLHEDAVVR